MPAKSKLEELKKRYDATKDSIEIDWDEKVLYCAVSFELIQDLHCIMGLDPDNALGGIIHEEYRNQKHERLSKGK